MSLNILSVNYLLRLFSAGSLTTVDELEDAFNKIIESVVLYGETIDDIEIWNSLVAKLSEVKGRVNSGAVLCPPKENTRISQSNSSDINKPFDIDAFVLEEATKIIFPHETQDYTSKLLYQQSATELRSLGNSNHQQPGPSSRSTCQSGSGAIFKIINESARYVKKFNASSKRITFSLGDLTENCNLLEKMQDGLKSIIHYSLKDCNSTDMVGLTISNSNFPHKPVGISFRRADQLTIDVVWSVLEKVLQSNAQFLARDLMTINVDKIEMPIGYGRRRMQLTGYSFKDFCERKSGIIVINNLDNRCLAKAIVLAIALKEDDPQLIDLLSDGSELLNERSLRLCQSANVDLSNGGRLEHIELFQNYLVDVYTIVVYNCRLGKTTMFEGPKNQKPRLNLIFEENHFNVIESLTAAFTCGYYCELCHYRYNNKQNHLNCPYVCPCCQNNPPCSKQSPWVNCNKCSRTFRGNECYEQHKNTTCDKIKRCLICLDSYYVTKKKHICNHSYCNICQQSRPKQHLCYMPSSTNAKNMKKFLFIFYDLECRQEKKYSGSNGTYEHEVNLCVSQHVCVECVNNNNMNEECSVCGKRQRIFSTKPVENFLEYVSKLSSKFTKVVLLAHNMQGYDGHFILKEILNNKKSWTPKIIFNGCKIISISCGRFKFLDSLNFLPTALCNLPKMFNFEGTKGYFPHFFNKLENINYVGPLPNMEYYGCEQMSENGAQKFLEWYACQVLNETVFNFKEELIKYCVMDVDILRKSCLIFWKDFVEKNHVDPFQESCTIASACNIVFRRLFLKHNTIAVEPRRGYRAADKQSLIAVKWLLYVEHSENIHIKHALNGREVRLGTGLLVDGYCENTRTVYEFHGCYFHGCERCYPQQRSPVDEKDSNNMLFRRERNEAKMEKIISLGYNLVQMWECKFNLILRQNENIRNFLSNHPQLHCEPLNPRDSFFGGRTNAVKLYHKCVDDEKIHYMDYTSLYPFRNKYGKYPVGHPSIHIGHDACEKVSLSDVEGLIKCTVLAPKTLYHPLLPARMHGKLMFFLCFTCALELANSDCTHTDQERQFTGTYVADELRKALSLGYQIIQFHEIWKYNVVQYDRNTKTGSLFSGYIDNFLKMKQEANGWPIWCTTDELKNKYISDYLQREGIQLDKNNICKNSGLRSLAKLMLNSFWGKFGQRENQTKTVVICEAQEMFDKLVDPTLEVHSMVFINDTTLILNYEDKIENLTPVKTVNVAIAAYTTAGARLELYKCLEQLKQRVLYFDTDSVVYISKPGDFIPSTGDYLGDLTDELSDAYGEGSYITEFVSGGPKVYSYNVYSTRQQKNVTVCKVKGITLNSKNSEIVNFETIKKMVLENNDPVYVSNDKKIARTSNFSVISKPETKMFKVNYTKRRRIENTFETLPFGFNGELL